MSKSKIPADLLIRWEAAKKINDETADACSTCQTKFVTGDVSLLYGDLDNLAAARLYICPPCYHYRPEFQDKAPSATMVYVQNEHRLKQFDELPTAVRDHLVEAFKIVDTIHKGVADWIEKNTIPAKENEQPS